MSHRLSNPNAPAAPATTARSVLASSAIASPPAALAVMRFIDIAAPVDKVWAVIGDFADLSYFATVVERTEIVTGENNLAGAQRRITLKSGGIILETLITRHEKPYSLSYRMDEGELPLSDYHSTISAASSDNGSKVTWQGAFLAAEIPGAPERLNGDQHAVDFIAGLYESGLRAIKETVER